MGDIYQNAALTIAASSSSDCHGGCYNTYSQSQDLNVKWERLVKSNIPDGQTSCLIFGKHRQFQASVLEPLPLADSRLTSRGWILQERLLSPRTIHYTWAQVVWECCRFYQTEDNIPFPATERPTRVTWLRFPKVGESDLDILWYTNMEIGLSQLPELRRFSKPQLNSAT